MSTATATAVAERRRVRVWFGEHAIVDFVAEPGLAERYAAAMRRRFISLQVTNELLGSPPDEVQP